MNKPIRKNAALIASAQAGLSQPQKVLDPKWFYDEQGSQLFDRITRLPEDYPTRTEIRILSDNREAISRICEPGCVFIEPGSGSCEKVRLLLESLQLRKVSSLMN